LFNKTAEFSKKLRRSPEKDLIVDFVRTTTALDISPFFILEVERRFVRRFFTETTIKSPTPAYLLRYPDKTLMQETFFAPELSITFKKVPA